MEAHKRAAHDPKDAPAPESRRIWLAENREAIEAYNEHVRKHGVFSAGLRAFKDNAPCSFA